MANREFSWLAMVIQAEPDHYRLKRNVIEYEFTAVGRGDERTHENGMRVFRGNYDVRGPYTPSASVSGGLTWNGRQLTFGDQELTWGDD